MCRRGILNIDGQADLEIKNLFPDFFSWGVGERSCHLSGLLVYVCIYRNSLGEGLRHAMKQGWEDGAFDRGP